VKLKPAAQVKYVPSFTLNHADILSLRQGESLIVHTAGAGGWGVAPPTGSVVAAVSGQHLLPATKANGSVAMYTQAQAECD
jgi:hypothetical protein